MSETTANKHISSLSGAAIILFLNKWVEILRVKGKDKDQPYTVPETGTLTIRFSVKDNPEIIGKQVRIFMESD